MSTFTRCNLLKSLIICLICFTPCYSIAQDLISISGLVTDTDGKPLPGVSIHVNGLTGSISGQTGAFQINVSKNTNRITFTALGKKPHVYKLSAEEIQARYINVKMEDATERLQAVEIMGLSKVDVINKQAFNVTAVDAKKLHNASMDVGQMLNRVPGVKIREAGGLGSQSAISLNGFSGNQVKLFLDGLPADNYGSSFQVNNIPVNYIDHIEIYRGVVPVWLGGDALGGAINLVKNTNPKSFLDVSYSYGSFNTHRATLNAGYIAKNGFTAELNYYNNYSDNNYKVLADVVPDFNTGVTVQQYVRRFHDMYRNQMLTFNVGLSNKSWADQLLLGINLGNNHADIQTGNRMAEIYGARFREGDLVQPTLQYSKKDLGLKGLDVSLRASFNLGSEKSVDTVFRRFNWFGQSEPKSGNTADFGGERAAELYIYKNNNGNAALNVGYKINDNNSLYLNNTFTSADRTGNNRLQPNNDFYKQPKITQKNILGLGIGNASIKNLVNNVFVKYYHQYVKAYNVYNNVYSTAETSNNFFGYGLASTYLAGPNTQLKFSYEKSYRVPELNELFGDVVNLDPNPSLKPESSQNLNLGISQNFFWNENNGLTVNAGAIYRYAKDYIRYVLSAVMTDGVKQVAQNQRDVSNLGFDADIRYSYKNLLVIGANVTYQNLRNQTKYETSKTDVSIFYRDRIPNIPYMFGSANAAYTFKDLFASKNNLTVGYDLFYVHQYFLRWPSAGASEKEVIPMQLSHDANITYSMARGRYNVSLEGRNLSDELLYDNYMLQKPSRNFSVKFRYVIK